MTFTMYIFLLLSLTEALQLERPPLSTWGRREWMMGATAASALAISGQTSPASAAEASVSSYLPIRPGSNATYDPVTVGEWSDMPELQTTLGQARIGSNEIWPFSQGLSLLTDKELYYNPFLFGAWNVTATLKRKIFPFGTSYLPSSSLVEGSPRNRQEEVGHSCTYEQRYFSTLANTLSNQITVNLGTGVPQSKIIQDRAFNMVSMSKAYQQLTPVQQVDWDYQKEPTRLLLDYGAPVADDMRPLGRRRATVYINGRTRVESPQGNSCVLEQTRSVLQAPGTVVVSDSETTTEYHQISDNYVVAVSRVAVFLSPNPNSREGVLWEQVGGRAVGLYDYYLDMHRIPESFTLEDGTVVQKACVRTPKDYVQCE
jgi:hypothetical protein